MRFPVITRSAVLKNPGFSRVAASGPKGAVALFLLLPKKPILMCLIDK